MGILKSILRVATWWNGSTLNTQLYTWRKGKRVGEDSQGNVYYTSRDGKRRWVMFNGTVEASRIDANWHGWLHHTFKETPTDAPLPHKAGKSHMSQTTRVRRLPMFPKGLCAAQNRKNAVIMRLGLLNRGGL